MRPRLHTLLAIATLAACGLPPIPEPVRRPPPRDPPKPVTVEDFHAHLDACRQCRENPMRMCSVGADLAELAGQSFGRELADTLPPGVDTVRVAPVDGAGGLASGVVVAGKVAARVMLDDVEPQTYRVLRAPRDPLAEAMARGEPDADGMYRYKVVERAPGPSFADMLPDLPTYPPADAWVPPHLRARDPGSRSTMSEAQQRNRKRKNKAARKARRGNR